MAAAKRFHIKRKTWVGYAFMMPFLILFALFIILPVLISFGMSFTNYNMIESPDFLGITNYKLLILDDAEFLIALKNTLVFAFISGPIGFLGSFVMAWLINNLKARNLFSLAFYAPSITSGVALSVVWLYFFSSDRYGLINNTLINLGVLSEPIQWTQDVSTVLPVVILISIWMSMGTGFLTFLAGLQNLPHEIYEAGMIDGIRNRFQELIYITLPQMKPQLLFGAINAAVGAFGVFDIAVSVAGLPSPNYAAHTIVAHLYDYAFIRFEMGYASAVAIILFLITFVLGRIFMRVFSEKD
ncbi:MAG: carbohydrate ABC transporter permease [Acutalibacteraceae bacterium]|nr:sugar ABC transporter permease [Clostridiales bacterium]